MTPKPRISKPSPKPQSAMMFIPRSVLLNMMSSSLKGKGKTVVSNGHLDDRMDLDVEMPNHPMPDLPIRTVAKQATHRKGNDPPKPGNNTTSMTNSNIQNLSKTQKKALQPQVSSCNTKQRTAHAQANTSSRTPAPSYRRNKPPRGPASQKPTKGKQADTPQNDEMELDTQQRTISPKKRLTNPEARVCAPQAVISEPGSPTVLKVNIDVVGNKQEIVCASFLRAIQEYSTRRKEIIITVCLLSMPHQETPQQRKSQLEVICSLVEEINKIKVIKRVEVRFKLAKGDGYGPQLFNVVPFYGLDYKFWTFGFFREGWMQSQTLREGRDLKSRILEAAERWNEPKQYRPKIFGPVFDLES